MCFAALYLSVIFVVIFRYLITYNDYTNANLLKETRFNTHIKGQLYYILCTNLCWQHSTKLLSEFKILAFPSTNEIRVL